MTRDTSLPFDSIAAVYDASRGGEQRGRRFAAALAPHLDRSSPVVDIGVGTGLVALGLAEQGFAVAGLDLSVPMLRVASGRISHRIACADATRLPIADASIEQAYSVWLLHLAPAAAILREVARVLAPSGRYAIVSSVVGGDASDDGGAILNDLMRTLDPDWAGGRLDGRDALAALAPNAGLTLEGAAVIDSPYETSPVELIERIRGRAYSRLVGLDDASWERLVLPAVAALEALPDPSRPRAAVARHDLVVLRR